MKSLTRELVLGAGVLLAFFFLTSLPASGQVSNTFLVLPLTNVWKYDASGTELGSSWRQPAYADAAWLAGPGVLAFEDNNALTISLTNTVLPLTNASGSYITNFYFRAHFTLTNDPITLSVTTSNLIDDGAVFYINGTEYKRIRIGGGTVTANTFAQNANPEGVFTIATIPSNLLLQGDNVIAVEVHQSSGTSPDIVFGMAMLATPIPQGPPSITGQPASNTIFVGQNSTFSVSAVGTAPLQYQWFKNGGLVQDATNASLSQPNSPFTGAGDYYVIITNSLGSATSSIVNLTVVGGETTLHVMEFTNTWRYNASGNDLSNTWRGLLYDDSPWPNGEAVLAKSSQPFFPEPINTPLPLSNVLGNAIITYYFRTHFTLPAGRSNLVLVASNLLDDGAVFYLNGLEAARLRVSGDVNAINFATNFAANAAFNGTFYERLFLAATNAVAGDNLLAVEVHQSSATSSDVVFGMNLRIFPRNDEPMSIVNQPASQAGNEGQSVRFFADTFGGQPVFYQWFQNGLPLTNGTNASLTLTLVHGVNAGSYSFIASNSMNAVTSTVAQLTIIPDPTPPTLVAAFATNDFNSVLVIFSEPVSAATATNVAHYTFSPGATVVSAQMVAPNRVLLTTIGRDVQFDYTLAVAGITDQADSPNTIVPASLGVGRDSRLVSAGLLNVKTVFFIIMENQDWSAIKGSTNCPYINSLLPQASYCQQYFSHNNLHPSEPNYIWLEAGDNFGFTTDAGPATNRIASPNHLATLLNNAGIDWRGYMEDLPPGTTGTNNSPPYTAYHNPFAFFDDVTTDFDYCTNHVRPFSQFAADLASGQIGRYNFITPNATNDMHDLAPGSTSASHQGDVWLAQQLPQILASSAFLNNGAVFITWDESNSFFPAPIGMIVLSPLAKGGGYASTAFHDHSSTLRTMQTIFGVRPFLGDAAGANTLSDLFQGLTLTANNDGLHAGVTLSNVVPGKTNYVQASSDLLHWTTINTNVANGPLAVPDPAGGNQTHRFYRTIVAP